MQKFIWQGVLGTTALYSAFVVHFLLGLYALYERRSVHWTAQEVLQLVLGLAVPPLLANHLIVTRVDLAAFGVDKGYAQELYSFWFAAPGLGWVQLALLITAWLHGCIGIRFWLRLQPWFNRVRGGLLCGMVLLPVLSLLSYLQGGRAVAALLADPAARAGLLAPERNGTQSDNAWLADVRNDFLIFDGGAVLLILLARLARSVAERRGRF